MKILLVDDSKMMRTIQKNTLTALGDAEFVEADDGQHALTTIGTTAGGFGLILIDWNMPNMDGLTLIKRIRANDAKTPLIMVTTEAEKNRVMEALKAGANNYVIKPFKAEMLLDKVKKTLGRAA